MDIFLVLAILIGTILLFITERFPIDFVAFIVLAALILLGLVTPEEAISGFSNPATITVAAMFVLSAAIERTGCLISISRLLKRAGKSPYVLLPLLMTVVGIGSAFVNNTAVVAVFLPVTLTLAHRLKLSPSKLLIPISFASQAGGVCTLIGTSTNLIVSSISQRSGFGPFAMFELAHLGLILLSVIILYFMFIGYFLLPNRKNEDLTKAYHLGDYITELILTKKSPLIGSTLTKTKFGEEHGVRLLKIIRNEKTLSRPQYEQLQENDILLVEGKIKDLMSLKDFEGLEIVANFELKDEVLISEDTTLVEAIVLPNSFLIGRNLREIDFYKRFNFNALALQRKGKTLYEKLGRITLSFGDTILLQGSKEDLPNLRANRNFAVLEELDEGVALKSKAPIAFAILIAVILLATLNILPIVASAIVGCVLLIFTHCLSMEEVYEAIDWRVIFLLGGIIPLGIAMEKSGAANWLVDLSTSHLLGWGPYVVLGALYLITTLLTEAISNNAAAILLAPIAISLASQLEVDPKPFLFAVTFAASTSFLTPVGYQTNTMVYSPGGYTYTDYLKVGIPINTLFWVISTLMIPYIWPF